MLSYNRSLASSAILLLHCSLTRFGIMGTQLTGLRDKDRRATMSRPTQPSDPG
jgi:hypothetical protein